MVQENLEWKLANPRAVRLVSVLDEDGLGWRTGDAASVEVTLRGESVPPRPDGVPATARYVFGEEPSWGDGATLYTSQVPIGRRRVCPRRGGALRRLAALRG